MTATSYNAIITSFDDDYYYGTFYRRYEEGHRQFLSHFYVCLDSEASSLYFDGADKIDQQTLTDFEVDGLFLLENKLFKTIYESDNTIFQAVKKEGGRIDLILR
jgi:hypothetical protein